VSKFGFLLVIVLLVLSFSGGFILSEYVKPPLPTVGSIELVGSWDADMGDLYCFDDESFSNLGDLLIELSKEFQDY